MANWVKSQLMSTQRQSHSKRIGDGTTNGVAQKDLHDSDLAKKVCAIVESEHSI